MQGFQVQHVALLRRQAVPPPGEHVRQPLGTPEPHGRLGAAGVLHLAQEPREPAVGDDTRTWLEYQESGKRYTLPESRAQSWLRGAELLP